MSKQEPVGDAGKKHSVNWTDRMDSAFIDAMVTQQEKGNRINGTFTTQAYTNMVEELNTKLQMNLTKNNLKNRLKSLKVYFSQWYDMFRGSSLSGFAWNSDTQLIEADDEVWENLINVSVCFTFYLVSYMFMLLFTILIVFGFVKQSKPEAVSLKTKKVANYDQMLVLFARDRASGAHAETAKEKNARLSKTVDIKLETIAEVDDLLRSNDVTLENQQIDADYDDIQVISPKCFSPEQNSSAKKCKSKRRKVLDEDEDEPFETKIMNVVADVANAMREGNKIFERAYHHEYTGDEIYKELQPMGLEPHEIPGALMYLARNQADARTLFSCPLNIRKDLLKTMMGAGN